MPPRLRPYALLLAMALLLPVLLVFDGAGTSLRQQHALGGLAFGLLALATISSPPAERRIVWTVAALWTLIELFASGVWGLYTYRLGNVPLFVPAGHGLIYLLGLRASRTPFVAAHAAGFRAAAVGCAATWAVGGVTLLPALTGRVDVAGVAVFPILAACVWRSSAGTFYAGVFFAASALEIVGTACGVWTWAETQPWSRLPQGNPPSVAAAGYCLMDVGIALLIRQVQATAVRRRWREAPA